MKRFPLIALLLAGLFLAACSGAPTLDASSDEALNASLTAMAEELSTEKKEQLAGSMLLLGMKGAFSGKEGAAVFAEYDGWTAEELVAEGRKLAAQSKE
ncbi:hypothetical protein SAMN02745704_01585 [Paucidesulfovibrio gracilis DSM 16080]|uniref:Uncharacterized protein n=1 Tax=Paucidesulfovibrio gracilis DSM 16080 TaxID=1121449 RepID=A0A1T4WZ66_9BACT|nr:DUF6694 family lipoprotein [Paucidesulfovibrio gracilis]SKA82616.1 hypothetical protein SAMN02745704_01585 [Paucidesulfovibrio gracilis DSM 16080]